jgi:SagB-type dehydrogenase family enzyme
MENEMKKYRKFLRDEIRLEMDFSRTDQNMGVEMPPLEKPYSEDARILKLPGPDKWKNLGDTSVNTAIRRRKSRRKYSQDKISIDELSFLLWATAGIRKKLGGVTLRTVPSAGNRHAIETYLFITNIEDIDPGIYRYLPLEHGILLESPVNDISSFRKEIGDAALGQYFIGNAPVAFIWTAIPYRMEWRYGIAAHKVIAIDAGHICQNLYIACEAIGAGTCAIAAYNQKLMDKLLGVDSEEEFTIYMAPVGKI